MSKKEINNVIYYKKDEYYIVGSNSSSSSSDGVSSTEVSGDIYIEEKIEGLPVQEIGRCAFFNCKKITRVTIYAKIRSINYCAFYMCINLQYINIPSTVTFIGNNGINLGTGSETVNLDLTVEFNEGRNEKIYLRNQAICRRTNIFILYPSSIVPLYDGDPFYEAVNVVICAPTSFTFCNKQTTTDSSKCPLSSYTPKVKTKGLKGCTCKGCPRGNNIKLVSLSIILLIRSF